MFSGSFSNTEAKGTEPKYRTCRTCNRTTPCEPPGLGGWEPPKRTGSSLGPGYP